MSTSLHVFVMCSFLLSSILLYEHTIIYFFMYPFVDIWVVRCVEQLWIHFCVNIDLHFFRAHNKEWDFCVILCVSNFIRNCQAVPCWVSSEPWNVSSNSLDWSDCFASSLALGIIILYFSHSIAYVVVFHDVSIRFPNH